MMLGRLHNLKFHDARWLSSLALSVGLALADFAPLAAEGWCVLARLPRYYSCFRDQLRGAVELDQQCCDTNAGLEEDQKASF